MGESSAQKQAQAEQNKMDAQQQKMIAQQNQEQEFQKKQLAQRQLGLIRRMQGDGGNGGMGSTIGGGQSSSATQTTLG